MPIGCLRQSLPHCLQAFDLLEEPPTAFAGMGEPLRPGVSGVLPVNANHLADAAFGISLEMGQSAFNLALDNVPAPVADVLNLLPPMAAQAPFRAPARRHSSTKRAQLRRIAEPSSGETIPGIASWSFELAAEAGDGLAVSRKAPGQPHHFDVAPGLPLKAAAGGDAVQTAVDE